MKMNFNSDIMDVAVWDTYVTRNDGRVMHFDIIVPTDLKDDGTIHTFGKRYLAGKKVNDASLTARECRFCHIEVATPEMISNIRQQGYHIVELQNCT